MSTPPDIATDSRAKQGAPTSRRRFLGAAAAASLLGASRAEAQPPRGGSRRGPLLPVATSGPRDAALAWSDPTLRLVRRVTMGITASEVALARRLGYQGYLEYQLNADAIDDSEVETLITTRLPMLSMAPQQMRTQDQGEVVNQLADAAWYRALFSKAQLRERMVEFWTDHFSIDMEAAGVGFNKVFDDRNVIRRHALGNFREMLTASAQSAAMLNYLNQNTSRTPTPNQNYAREIMELHTLGADGGYSQTDVAELSRILTGWSSTAEGQFRFVRTFHDRNAKVFLGRTFPAMASTASDAAMKAEGDLAIEMLLDHPSTARYVSYKMARWMLAYEPPADVVARAAAVFTNTRGDIKSVLRVILSSRTLLASPAKYKRPFHLATSAMRALGATPTNVPNVRNARRQADAMGQPNFRWDQPDGFPDTMSWWSGLVITRWSYAQYLSTQNSATAYRMDTAPFRVVDTPDGVVQQIVTRVYAGEMPTSLRSSLLSYLRASTYSDTRVREVISLALSAQEFQWY